MVTNRSLTVFPLLLAVALCCATPAFPCPRANGYKDINCDGKFTVLAIGDSVVVGVGDTKYKNKGGYVTRLQRRKKDLKALRVGVAGISSFRLYGKLVRDLAPATANAVNSRVRIADLIVIDVGRNDFYEGADPVASVRTIKRIVSKLALYVKNHAGYSPDIRVATLLPTRRDFQRTFLQAVNILMLSHHSSALPVDIRFDKVSVYLMTWFPEDGIHPSSAGYTAMEAILEHFIRNMFYRATAIVPPTPCPTPL